MATKAELEEQLKAAQKDLEALAQLAGERTASSIGTPVAAIEEYVDTLSDDARALFDNARAEGQRLREMTETQMRENPMMTVGIAVGVGFLLANLLRR